MIKTTGRWVKKIAITLVILVGILVGVLRFGLPLVSEYSEEVNTWLSDLTGIPINIRQLQVSWYGTSPQLRLLGVQILSPDRQQTLMGFAQIRIELDIFASLQAGALQTGLIQIVGASIVIHQGKNGEIKLAGLPDQMTQNRGPSDHQWLDNLAEIAIQKSTLTIKKGHFTFHYTDLDLVLRNQGQRHQIQGAALLANVAQNRVAFAGEWLGPLLHPEKSVGKIYFQADHFAIESLPIDSAYQGVEIGQGHLDLTLWARWDHVRLERVTGNLALQDFTLSGQASMRVKSFKSRFDWVNTDGQRRLNFKDAELQIDAEAQPIHVDFALQRDDAAAKGALIVNLKALDLAQSRVWGKLFPKSDIAEVLAQVAPRGLLQDVRLYSPISDGPLRFTASGRVRGLTTHFWEEGVPGLSAWDVDFVLTEAQGEMHFHSEHSTITFKRLFRGPLPMEVLNGRIAWYRQDQGWVVSGQNIHAKAADIDTLSRFYLRIPAQKASPYLALQVAFKDGNVVNAHRYLPTAIMGKAVVEWLDQAFVRGKVVQGTALVRGQLADFPFKKQGKGRFEVYFTVDDMVLRYQKGWPVITQMASAVSFVQDSLEITAKRGKIFRSTLHNAVVSIDQLSISSPLHIKGRVKGRLEDSLKFLRESPLWSSFQSWLGNVTGTGQHYLDLAATIALDGGDGDRVAGKIQFLGAELLRNGASLSQVTGLLSFTERLVKAKQIKAQLLDMPVQISINRGEGTDISVTINGVFDPKQALPPGSLTSVLSGKAHWQAKLRIPEQEGNVVLELESDLKGLAIHLPEPFAKNRQTAMKMTFSTTLGAKKSLARIRYGDQFNAIVEYQQVGEDFKITRGNINFGPKKARLQSTRGLSVTGVVPMLSWRKWRDWAMSTTSATSRPEWVQLNAVNVRVQRFEVNGRNYKDIALTLNRLDQEWRGTVKCQGAEGVFVVPTRLADEKPIVIHLKHFYFWKPTSEKPPQTAGTYRGVPDPWTIPAIQLTVDKLVYEDKNLGVLSLKTRPKGLGMQLQALQLTSKYLNLHGSGLWKQDEGQVHSEFELAFTSPKLGKTIALLGFPGVMKDGKAKAEAKFFWDDSPFNFSLKTLQGSAALLVEKGRFLDIEPGVGRAFGLLSFGTIQRRLSLDFSDLFEKGFAFDLMWGGFDLNEGEAISRNLYLDGPAALVEIIGGTDLVLERYDQIVVVTPKVTDSAPLAGAALGGPLVGASIWVVQKVVGGVIDKSVQKIYAVDGPWDAPVVQDTRQKVKGDSQSDVFNIWRKLGALLPKLGSSGASKAEEDEPVDDF